MLVSYWKLLEGIGRQWVQTY